MTPDDDTLIILDGLARRSRLGMILLALGILFGIAGLLLLPGCSYVRIPYPPDGKLAAESWNFFADSDAKVSVTLPDGTKLDYQRTVSPNAAAIEGAARGVAEGLVKGAGKSVIP